MLACELYRSGRHVVGKFLDIEAIRQAIQDGYEVVIVA
jgi:hypothetical protein